MADCFVPPGPILITELTEGTLEGTGVFDALMRASKVHIDAEYTKNRLRGPEYATVYLGAIEASMRTALEFLALRQKIPLDNAILVGQKCKLDAEYDLLLSTNLKTLSENGLLLQKTTTEKAQTAAIGVDADSVIGKQKTLYQAQTDGFSRDAEQKAAKLMVDSWNVRRTTDEGTVADGTNMLADSVVGRAVNKMLSGVGA